MLTSSQPMSTLSALAEPPLVETRIEDGKLLYERRWYHRGQSIYVEGRDTPKFPGSISAVGSDAVSSVFFLIINQHDKELLNKKNLFVVFNQQRIV